MSIKIGKIFEDVIKEATDEAKLEELFAPLTVENGMVKLWHYSNKLIEDDFISTRGSQGLHSRSEFRAWGKARAFFYGTKDGIKHDRGVSSDYMYTAHLPLKELYPVMINPNDYKVPKGEHYWQSIYEQATQDGYNAFIYNLGAMKGVPIIVSFVDVPIDEKYARSPEGYRNVEDKIIDYPIGTFTDEQGEEWIIMQRDNYIKTLNNTYLTKETDPEEAMDSYKKDFHVYQWKHANLFPKYESDYLRDLK